MRSLRFAFFLTGLLAFFTACNGGPFSDLTDGELRKKYRSCRMNPNPTTTATIICKNVKDECETRKKKGRKVC